MIADAARRFQLLPDVIDLSFVFTLSGAGRGWRTLIEMRRLPLHPPSLVVPIVVGMVAAGIVARRGQLR